jgi:catechol 2,3-dioxygenase-like lactoylglutathione lyase family enzyme
MNNIIGIDHIQIAIPRGGEDEARKFYGGILQLPEIEKPEPLRPRGGCWFTNGFITIHLGIEEGFSPARKAHPAFRVPDLDNWKLHLEEHDIMMTADTSLPDVRRFYVNDPFGNRIEFIEADNV